MVVEALVFAELWVKYRDLRKEIIKTMDHCGYIQIQHIWASFSK